MNDFQVFEREDIDIRKWDAIVDVFSNGHPYFFSWYLDIFCENWKAIVLDDYQAIMPLPIGNKWGVNYIYTPFFVQQLGILGNYDNQDLEGFLAIVGSKYKFVELKVNFNIDKNQLFIKQINTELNMSDSYEKIVSGYSSNHKRNIKKAINSSLYIENSKKAEALIELFRKNKGREINTYKEDDYRKLKELIYYCLKNEMGEVLLVKKESELIAGAFFYKSSKRSVFLFSGNSSKGFESSAMFFVFDSFIKNHCNEIAILDFEGSNNENLLRFYQGFGAKIEPYYFMKINNLFWPFKYLKKFIPRW